MQVGQVQYDVHVGHLLGVKPLVHKTFRIDPATADVELRALDVAVRAAIGTGRAVTVTVANGDELLSPQQVAARLRLSRQHVRRLIDAGEMQAEHMPNSRYWKVPLASVLAFEQRREAARALADEHSRELDRLGAPLE